MPKYKPRAPRPRPAFERDDRGAGAVVVGRYRYSLSRWWRRVGPRIAWVMLNPSTADAAQDDPTIRRVVGFSKAWGFTHVEVVNLFAYRTPSPARLWERRCDIVGPQNRDYLRAAIFAADRVMVAWGAAKDGRIAAQVDAVKAIVRPAGILPQCLGTTQSGAPRHPLYLAADTKPVRWPEITSPFRLASYPPPGVDSPPNL